MLVLSVNCCLIIHFIRPVLTNVATRLMETIPSLQNFVVVAVDVLSCSALGYVVVLEESSVRHSFFWSVLRQSGENRNQFCS